MTTPTSKKCNGCGREQPLERFWRNKKGRFGRYSLCRDCPSGLIAAHQRATRSSSLKSKYGIDIDEYERIWYSQGGRCAVCNRRGGSRGLAVDHNHETNQVRGLLCGECNMGLGRFHDNPVLLSRATEYLLRRGYDKSYEAGRTPGWLAAIYRKLPAMA